MLLYIVRHGDPVYNPDSLTEKGKRQAEAVGRRLATRHFDRVYASGMLRAQQTAQPLCELSKLEMGIEEWASESLAWRDLSMVAEGVGRTWCFLCQPPTAFRTEESERAGDEWYKLPCFSMVDGQAAIQRIVEGSDDFLARQGYMREGRVYRITRPNDDRVAIFCHQGFGLTWLSHLLDIPPHLFWSRFDMTHTGVTILEFANAESGITAPKCLCLSDMSHLYAERLPMTYQNGKEV